MAIYEFECRGCGQRFEVQRSMAEHERLKAQPPSCPGCGKSETRELAPLVGWRPPSS